VGVRHLIGVQKKKTGKTLQLVKLTGGGASNRRSIEGCRTDARKKLTGPDGRGRDL